RAAVPEGYPLMGGMDTLSFLNRTQDEITAEANACIAGAGRNGAFILGTGCVLPPGSDPGLIRAAAAAAHSKRIE
ncbi:MAG: hypothetical protein JXB33_07920, partial [Clostridia bacterium]|nr:hypothetical protein [Clostridia bacterium]